MDFVEFPKMARFSREVIVTEKIDGTNAQVYIELAIAMPQDDLVIARQDGYALMVGSRTRWITPKDDNFGFAAWAQANADELFKLGVGRHFGEWFGSGIQRGYGLKPTRGKKRRQCTTPARRTFPGRRITSTARRGQRWTFNT